MRLKYEITERGKNRNRFFIIIAEAAVMWREKISNQLDLRDSREKAFESLILSFNRLQLKEDRARTKQAKLKAENEKLLNLACAQIFQFDDKGSECRLSELRADQQRLLRDAAAVELALGRTADELDELTAQLAATELLAGSLQLEVGRLRTEARRLVDERERMAAELASSEARLAELAARERGLARENRRLLARWLGFSRRVAERLNRQLEATEAATCVGARGGGPGILGEVAWSPATVRNGSVCQLMASTVADGPARVWTVKPGKPQVDKIVAELGSGLSSVQFCPAGRLLAGAAPDCVRLWSADDCGRVQLLKERLPDVEARAVRFLPTTPGRLATGGQLIRLWDLAADASSTAQCSLAIDCAAPCADLAAPDSEPATLAASHSDGRVRLFDARESAGGRGLVLADCAWPAASLAACPARPCRLLAGLEAQLLLLDSRVPGRPLADLCADGLRLRPGNRCSLSPGGRLAAVGSADGRLHVWNCDTGRLLERRPLGRTGATLAASWRPDDASEAGRSRRPPPPQVATCDRSGRVRIDRLELEFE